MLPLENRLGVNRGLDALSQRSARSASSLRVDEGTQEAASAANPLEALRPVQSEQRFDGSTSGQGESQEQQLSEAAEPAAAPASLDVISIRFDPELSSEARLASAKNASSKTFGRTRAPLRRAATPAAAQLPGQGLRAYSSGQALARQTANLTVDVVL